MCVTDHYFILRWMYNDGTDGSGNEINKRTFKIWTIKYYNNCSFYKILQIIIITKGGDKQNLHLKYIFYNNILTIEWLVHNWFCLNYEKNFFFGFVTR